MLDKAATSNGTSDHTLRLEPNLFTGRAVSDGRTYSISLIDANKNKIPTGTELFVQGTLLTAQWTQDDACTWLLSGRHSVVQHGEVDPTLYCHYSILLTEKRNDGGDMWPGVALVCDVTPQEMQEVTHLYHYGNEVQVHGSYAASLDFGVVPAPGGHFGVPVLEGCTFADPTDKVVGPESAKNLDRPTTPPELKDQFRSSAADKASPKENDADSSSHADGGVASEPVLLYSPEPEFSEEARKEKFNGVVLVSLIVDEHGMPQNVHVLNGVGKGLDEKAVEAVQQYRFKPAMQDGKPVPIKMNVQVNFQIF